MRARSPHARLRVCGADTLSLPCCACVLLYAVYGPACHRHALVSDSATATHAGRSCVWLRDDARRADLCVCRCAATLCTQERTECIHDATKQLPAASRRPGDD